MIEKKDKSKTELSSCNIMTSGQQQNQYNSTSFMDSWTKHRSYCVQASAWTSLEGGFAPPSPPMGYLTQHYPPSNEFVG